MSLSSGIGETCHTRILAQASCVDSVPLSSLISMEPRYCNEMEGKDITADVFNQRSGIM